MKLTARRGWPRSPCTPTGELQSGFKVWLHGAERQAFRPGDRTVILDVDGWKIALAICRDASRPEHAGEGAEAGADIYAVSALYTAGEEHRLALHLGARAMDNRMYSVLANLGGTTELGPSAGGSGFWGPGRARDPAGRRDGDRGADRDPAARRP